ncbi:MAG: outer membrane beta-barrel protein [Erythrobacter sp.]
MSQVASPVAAQDSGPYGSIGAVYATSDADEIEPVSEDSGHIQARAGYSLNRYLAVEAEASVAVAASGAGKAGRDDARFILDRHLAGFAVVRYPVTERFGVFVRGGYHHSRISIRADGDKASAWRDDFAYGAGATYSLDSGHIRFDYTMLQTDIPSESVNHRLISISYVKEF